jgi:hypothetical protein
MRRDEQRGPVLVFPVFLATMPSPRHALAGDGERVVGRGTFRDTIITVCSIYGSNIHPSISFRLASGGGGVGVYQPTLGRQGRRQAWKTGQGETAGSWPWWAGGQLSCARHQTVVVELKPRVGRLQQSSSDSAQRPSAAGSRLHTLDEPGQEAGQSARPAVVCAMHNRFGMLARTLSR